MYPALVVFLPLLSLLASLSKLKISNLISTLIISCSSLLSWSILLQYSNNPFQMDILTWFDFGNLKANWSIYCDRLTLLMFAVITSVSSCVHWYSIGYMGSNNRFFAYLSLFTFCMLMLVCSNNLMQLFFGWEGVGVCSYLLIGFWFKKSAAKTASIKAFIVNRAADIAFVLGILVIYNGCGSVEFESISTSIIGDEPWIEIACILLFIGCMGKSAQLGLHVWLPDAMEGPTPVSALIHAATMVTAGVFLICRCSFLFEVAPITSQIILITGSCTAIFGAGVAFFQNDIKKIIAYSTCSQLGYMFMACGSLDFSAAMFHLFTHAFFKSLLFLCAGIIIYSAKNQQDIFKIGLHFNKLRFQNPLSYYCLWIGSLSITGIFPFSGFFSKDLIIESVYFSDNLFAYISSLLVVVMTSLYSLRLIIITFHSPKNDTHEIEIKKPNIYMNYAVIILSILSIFAGYIGKYFFLDDFMVLSQLFRSSVFWGDSIGVKHYHVTYLIKFLPLICSVFTITTCLICKNLFFGKKIDLSRFCKVAIISSALSFMIHPFALTVVAFLYLLFRYLPSTSNLIANALYFDSIYKYLILVPFHFVCSFLSKFFDAKVIDRFLPQGAVDISLFASNRISKSHLGFINSYLLWAFYCIVGILTYIIFF